MKNKFLYLIANKNQKKHENQRIMKTKLISLVFIGGVIFSANAKEVAITKHLFEQKSNQTEISGQVVGQDDGMPIAGATIYAKGNNKIATITDETGKFKLNVPENETHIIVTYMGYASLEYKLDNKQDLVQPNHFLILARIRKNIASLESNAPLMVEHLYPQIAARKIEAHLRHIRTDTGPDDMSLQPSVRAKLVQQRIDAFNKITGWDFTEDDHELIENIIDNPEQLHIWLAFEEISNGNSGKAWIRYKATVNFLELELKDDGIGKMDVKTYDSMEKWTGEKAKSVYDWIKTHIPDVEPKAYAWSFQI